MSNIVLQKVYAATSPDDNVTPASILFDMCVSKDYVIDYNNPVPNMVPKIDPETGEVMKDENGEIIMEVEVDYEGNVVYTYPRMPDPSDPSKDYYTSGWRNNNSVETLSKIVQSDGWNSLTPDKVFGVHKKVLGLFEDADKKIYNTTYGRDGDVQFLPRLSRRRNYACRHHLVYARACKASLRSCVVVYGVAVDFCDYSDRRWGTVQTMA